MACKPKKKVIAAVVVAVVCSEAPHVLPFTAEKIERSGWQRRRSAQKDFATETSEIMCRLVSTGTSAGYRRQLSTADQARLASLALLSADRPGTGNQELVAPDVSGNYSSASSASPGDMVKAPG